MLSIRELQRILTETSKPLVIWAGAGTSKWLGYPLWKELALDLRRDFFKFVPGLNNNAALELINKNSFPEFFQMCHDLDRQRFYRFLSDAFLPKGDTVLNARFIELLFRIAPIHVLTTNVDESIEQRFPDAAIYQPSDLTGCVTQLGEGRSFIAKLHGSRSRIEATVFTRDDYEVLKKDTSFINTLKHIFAISTVIFLGYSVTDEYVLQLLSDDARDMSLFGAGPHFVVSSQFRSKAPLRQINYAVKRFPDHRAALSVLDIVWQSRQRAPAVQLISESRKKIDTSSSSIASASGYYISDCMPPGTWNNSTVATFNRKDGTPSQLTVGLGFTNDEVPFHDSPAAHDLAVGLTCFDITHFPLSNLNRVFTLLGESLFRTLLISDAIKFVHIQQEPAVVSVVDGLMADIGLVRTSTPDGQDHDADWFIRQQLNPQPGKEKEAEALFSQLQSKVVVFDRSNELALADLVRSSVMMPHVSKLLGIGEAILPTQVPVWLTFPYLRLAHLVQTGAVCEALGLQAAKIPFGGSILTSAAFGVQAGTDFSDRYASYVFSGRFDADLGALFFSDPTFIQIILKFRNTAEGETLRREVRQQLLANEATAFAASVNAGLSRGIPLTLIQRARDKVTALFTESMKVSPVGAVWANASQTDDTTRYWRSKSRQTLLQLAKRRNVSGDAPCICGSGDKFRLCCLLPLRD